MGKKKKEEKDGLPVSKCPDNMAFKQQRLPAWRPLLTAESVLSSFFIIGLFCLAVGISWVVATTNVKEIRISYSDYCSDCTKLRENSSNSETPCSCTINFSITESFKGDVFMYYGLSNFFQNHRRYVISKFDAQLLGRNVTNSESIKKLGYCAPFSVYNNGTPIAPCGAIANSMFNDTILLFYHPDASTKTEVPLFKTGNTWWSDKNVKFSNPKPKDNLVQAFAGSARPPYWQKPAYELDPLDPNNNAYINEDFINWMRVAALPSFRKLYRRLSRVDLFSDGLPAGNYTFVIDYNFPVSKFGGRKHAILSTLSWCGGSNVFLGYAYTVTGAVIILTAFVMLALHLKKTPKKKKPFFAR
ncbi:PREDICTED: cell cycle control protein 50C-like [Nanorana parkeri]|uniref:cell cycle control protein 50C-like n=1 Tax=Nanorana parkeri TaxID=125878 RepID=UPI0008541C6F|nr:PREDICTED: cell cycle control protein 50C-like [Nanorana parkeri]